MSMITRNEGVETNIIFSNLLEDNNNFNGSGHTFIFMAFAEVPFKYANAR